MSFHNSKSVLYDAIHRLPVSLGTPLFLLRGVLLEFLEEFVQIIRNYRVHAACWVDVVHPYPPAPLLDITLGEPECLDVVVHFIEQIP